MRYAQLLCLIPLIVVIVIGCGKKNDEADIQALLEESWFVGDGATQSADDSSSTPKGIGVSYLATDTIKYARWVRWIERPVHPEFDPIINGDSAEVTITAYFHGQPPGYGFFVNNDPLGPIYQRTISDSVIRKVKLYHDDTGWHIASLTVADIYTVGAAHPVTISEVKAAVASRQYEFVVNSANTYFEKDELPIFYPNDTVEVTVTCSADGDSTWAFLHHGAGHKPGAGLRRHWRQPFYRETTTTFKRTWIIADDSVLVTPAVRHSAVDVVGWQTLWGDSTETYYSRAWGLPYIIKAPEDEIPPDTTSQ